MKLVVHESDFGNGNDSGELFNKSIQMACNLANKYPGDISVGYYIRPEGNDPGDEIPVAIIESYIISFKPSRMHEVIGFMKEIYKNIENPLFSISNNKDLEEFIKRITKLREENSRDQDPPEIGSIC